MAMLISALFIALCLGMIYFDLRHMRIPDALSLAFVVLFAVSVVILWPAVPIGARLLAAAIVFAVTFALFALRIMGGGDTKVIPAMTLFVPFAALSQILLLFAVCLLASIAGVLAARTWIKAPPDTWAVFTSKKLPMGLAIGATGLIAQTVHLMS